MNKIMKSLLIEGVLAANSSVAFAATLPQTSVSASEKSILLERSIVSNATLKSDHEYVKYSKFIKNGDGELWVKLTLEGASFNTSDPYEIKNAITQNYDIQTSLSVSRDGKSIEFGVYEPSAGIEYLDNWKITIDSSVLPFDNYVTVKIPIVR